MAKILNINKFCEKLKEVSTTKIIEKKKFHPDGLFSEQIFGPLKNYTCQCGTYYGASRSGGTCEECHVDIVNSDERRRRFAKIVLPIPVVNPIFYDLLVELGASYVKTRLDTLMKSDKSVLYKKDGRYEVTTNPETIPTGCQTWEKMDAMQELIRGILNYPEVKDNKQWNVIKENVDCFLMNYIIVLPPDLRPAAKGVERNRQVVDKINRYYVQLLTKKESMKDTVINIERDKSIYYTYFKQIQKDVNELYTHIVEKLSKKEGLIRGNILGKRIDFSGRAVISPDPTLNIDECSIPILIFLELFKIKVAKKLIDQRKFKLLNSAIDYIDDCIELKKIDPALVKVCEELSEGEVCILNRQPSLHRLSMIGFKIKITLDDVIKIHPMVCAGFNADFDGDQMAVYIPVSEEAKKEIYEKFISTKNFSNPANSSLTTTPSQDIILGIYTLTANKFPNLMNKVQYKGKEITEGQKIFNECLPESFPIIANPVSKKDLIRILNVIKNNYSNDITAKTLDDIKKIGFKYSTLFGATMSLDGCSIGDDMKEFRDDIYKDGGTRDQLNKVSGKDTEDYLRKHFTYGYLIDSGARGTWEQARQIVLTRGFVSNFNGEILPYPIKHSLLEGLTEEEFFNSTYGARKGLLDVALNTGDSGYLSRKLIFTCVNLQLDKTLTDCGTKDTLEIYVNDEKKARMLLYRNFINKDGRLDKVSESNLKDLVGKTIKVRSPIFCKSDQICTTCYGDLYKFLDSRFIGVIAAHSLGECNTQLILRVFHTSGIAVIKNEIDVDMQQRDIIDDLSSVSRLLHQIKDKNYTQLVQDLYDVYNQNREIHHVHFECVVSQLMWKGFQKWRLIKGREKIAPDYHSVQTVPSYESWLLGLAFSNPRKHILKGIRNPGRYRGVMDRMLCGEKII